MPFNSFGKYFKITTFGESRSKALGVVIDGVKPGIDFDLEFIKEKLSSRKPGNGKYSTSRKEQDNPVVLSGIYEGKTLGTPICIVFFNHEQSERDYEKLKDIFRPGHADFSWFKKYGIRDHRGGGRSSGRETVARVAAGAFALYLLNRENIKISAYTVQIGNIKANKISTFDNQLKFADPSKLNEVKNLLDKLLKEGNSTGAIVEVSVKGLPAGTGDPVFEKLNANLAKSVLSIGGIRGIEFGAGFNSVSMTGWEHNDFMNEKGFESNNAGGISGGISNGEELIFRCAIKPVSSISIPQPTVTKDGKPVKISVTGRHDTVLIPRIIPVIESMTAITVLDAFFARKYLKYDDENNTQISELEKYRDFIDDIDREILQNLAGRFEIVQKIKSYKQNNNIKISDETREDKIREIWTDFSEVLSLDPDFSLKILEEILKESKKLQAMN